VPKRGKPLYQPTEADRTAVLDESAGTGRVQADAGELDRVQIAVEVRPARTSGVEAQLYKPRLNLTNYRPARWRSSFKFRKRSSDQTLAAVLAGGSRTSPR
jgi:hypothetical protein